MNLLALLILAVLVAAPLPTTDAGSKAAAPQARNVAILAFDGMEILDFAGPSEVFQASGEAFNVYTVGATSAPILSQRFVTITPRYTIQTAPAPDILVVPGGGTEGV